MLSAEVMHHTGVMDDIPSLTNEQRNFLVNLKGQALKNVDAFRIEVRRRLNPQTVQSWIDKDKLGALGLASGAFVGTVL